MTPSRARPGESPRIWTEPGAVRIREEFAAERKCLALGLPIPDLERAIVTRRQHGSAVGTERDSLDGRRMRGKHLECLPGGHIPQAHAAIRAAGSQRSTVRAERNLPTRPVMAFETMQQLPTGRIPNSNDSVVSRDGQVPAISAVRHAATQAAADEDLLRRFKRVQRLAGPRIPNFNRSVHGDRSNLSAVWAESHYCDNILVLQRRRIAVALPLEEVPLPAAPVERALVEQLLGATDVACGQLALRQGDALGVRTVRLRFRALLRLLALLGEPKLARR